MNWFPKGLRSPLFVILTIILCVILAFALVRGISTGVREANESIQDQSQAK